MTTPVQWNEQLARFSLATPELVAVRELRRRTDTKFVLTPEQALDFLGALAGEYVVLVAGDARIATYRTLYFDTPDLEFFHAHRCGRRVRQKVRIRHYPDRHLSVLEVKSRRSDLESAKISREHPYGESVLSAEERAFLSGQTGCGQQLREQVWTDFRRITLLGSRTRERVTIDLELVVEAESVRIPLNGLAIVEVKQRPFCRDTPAMTALRAGGRRPGALSKYCAAMAVVRPALRINRLLPDLRVLQRSVA